MADTTFTDLPPSLHVASNGLCFAIRDKNPVSEGHLLIIPFRNIETWFDATADEWSAAFDLISTVKKRLDQDLSPDGYNVGFNAGLEAGQTVFHAHIHVIPRYSGDVENPAGGVRHVVPSKGSDARK